jgi:hypothetical protein
LGRYARLLGDREVEERAAGHLPRHKIVQLIVAIPSIVESELDEMSIEPPRPSDLITEKLFKLSDT